MDADARRRAKEAFVTGHTGGEISDISLLVLSCGLAVVASHLLLAYKLKKWQYQICDFLLSFIIPLLVSLYTTQSILFVAGLVWLLFLIYINYPFYSFTLPHNAPNTSTTQYRNLISNQDKHKDQVDYIELASTPNNNWEKDTLTFRTPAISRLRSALFILTAVAILGVDFVIFPRYNAKTEEYGTGLMDIGVGGFLFCNALVHPLARGTFSMLSSNNFFPSLSLSAHNSQQYHKISNNRSIYSIIIKPVQSILPALVVGVARFLILPFINYQHHVSEYGVHWNFFFTLGSVMILCSLFHYMMVVCTPQGKSDDKGKNNHPTTITTQQPSPTNLIINSSIFIAVTTIIGFALLFFYHHLLFQKFQFMNENGENVMINYVEWIFGTDRSTLLAQNKEGIFSLFGYFALAVIAMGLGRALNVIQFYGLMRYSEDYQFHLSKSRNVETKRTSLSALHNNKRITISSTTSSLDPELEFTLRTQTQVWISRIQGILFLSISIIMWFATQWAENNLDRISRRLCNLSFCFWTLHIATLLAALCTIPDIIYYLRFNPNRSKNDHVDGPEAAIPHDMNNRHTNPWSFNTDRILSLQYHRHEAVADEYERNERLKPKTLIDVMFNNKNGNNHSKKGVTHNNHNMIMDNTQGGRISNQNNNKNQLQIHQQQDQPKNNTKTTFNKSHLATTLSSSRTHIKLTSHYGSDHIPDLFNPTFIPKRIQRPKHRQTAVINKDIYERHQNRLSVRPNITYNEDSEEDHSPDDDLQVDGLDEIDIDSDDADVDGGNNDEEEFDLKKVGYTSTPQISRQQNKVNVNNKNTPKLGKNSTKVIDISHQSKDVIQYNPHKINMMALQPQQDVTTISSNINLNAFKYFILTNLCTGLTNQTISTMDQSDLVAFCILVVYLLVSYLAMLYFPLFEIIKYVLIKPFTKCFSSSEPSVHSIVKRNNVINTPKIKNIDDIKIISPRKGQNKNDKRHVNV